MPEVKNSVQNESTETVKPGSLKQEELSEKDLDQAAGGTAYYDESPKE